MLVKKVENVFLWLFCEVKLAIFLTQVSVKEYFKDTKNSIQNIDY